jgi:4-diphosphocytidyl-2-C-methyl-D-erythritol kinase
MTWIEAPAKINLALVVGPAGPGGKHEVVSVMEALTLTDRIRLEPADMTGVVGFPEDTIVSVALAGLAAAAGYDGGWSVEIEKRIPVAAGLGGGSSDAGTALREANRLLPSPLAETALHALAARVGADVPFFLKPGPRLATGDGSAVTPIRLPRDYAVLLVLPEGTVKASTGSVYRAFDRRSGEVGYAERESNLRKLLTQLSSPRDLARLPPNDLAESPLADRVRELGAFRADVSGAGPTVYGLFEDETAARAAEGALAGSSRTWVTRPFDR